MRYKYFFFSLVGIIFAVFLGRVIFAWTNPTQSPPDGSGSLTSFPSGAVVFFNLSSCPTGWSEYTAGRGRYVVGLPSSGTLAGTTGTALSNLENRAVGQHNHAIIDPGHSHTYWLDTDTVPDGGTGGAASEDTKDFTLSTDSSVTGITVDNAGSVAGTNAPFIQLLACVKD
jgi:hypothetical protein